MLYFSHVFICVCRVLNMDQPFDVYTSWRGSLHIVMHIWNMLERLKQGSQMLIPILFVVLGMRKYAKNLGLTNVAEFFYQIPQMVLHNGLYPFKEDGYVRALHDLLEFALERLIHIYVKHIKEAGKEQVDEVQGNEGDDEHEFHKEGDERVGVDDNIFIII